MLLIYNNSDVKKKIQIDENASKELHLLSSEVQAKFVALFSILEKEVCMKSKPKTISIEEFAKNFSYEQKQIVEEEKKYYYLLTSFKEAREAKGISQEELAKKANINRTTFSKIETGLRNATVGTLIRLAYAMDMKLDIQLKA